MKLKKHGEDGMQMRYKKEKNYHSTRRRIFAEKCWGDENFNLLTNLLLKEDSLEISIIGSKEDRARIRIQESDRLKTCVED